MDSNTWNLGYALNFPLEICTKKIIILYLHLLLQKLVTNLDFYTTKNHAWNFHSMDGVSSMFCPEWLDPFPPPIRFSGRWNDKVSPLLGEVDLLYEINPIPPLIKKAQKTLFRFISQHTNFLHLKNNPIDFSDLLNLTKQLYNFFSTTADYIYSFRCVYL